MRKHLKKSILLIIIILALFTLTGCSLNFNFGEQGEESKTTSEQTSELEGLPVYTADTDMTGYTKCEEMQGVEFYYPSNYISVGKEEQPMFMDTEIAGASVNIVSSEIPSAFSFEGFVDASIIGIKNEMEINGDVNKEYINLNGRKAAKLEYTTDVDGSTMKVVQVIILKDTQAYILTMGGFESDATELQPKLDKMIKSFK